VKEEKKALSLLKMGKTTSFLGLQNFKVGEIIKIR
jgi:hypothetical protein